MLPLTRMAEGAARCTEVEDAGLAITDDDDDKADECGGGGNVRKAGGNSCERRSLVESRCCAAGGGGGDGTGEEAAVPAVVEGAVAGCCSRTGGTLWRDKSSARALDVLAGAPPRSWADGCSRTHERGGGQ